MLVEGARALGLEMGSDISYGVRKLVRKRKLDVQGWRNLEGEGVVRK